MRLSPPRWVNETLRAQINARTELAASALVRQPTGSLVVLELELVEPELFFRLSPTGAEHLAAYIDSNR